MCITILMNSRDPSSFLKRVSDNIGYLATIGAFVSTIIGFIKLVQGDLKTFTPWLLIGGVVALWLLSIYYYRFWNPESQDGRPNLLSNFVSDPNIPEEEQGKKEKWRRQIRWIAKGGTFALPVLLAVGCGTWQYIQNLPSKHTIVLLAKFQNDVTEEDSEGVTETLFRNLKEPLSGDPNTKLIRIDTSFETEDEARSAGKDHKAALVIWGGYIKIPDDPTNQTSMKLEILQPLQVIDENKETAELADDAQGNNQEVSCDQLKQLQIGLRTHISQEMSYFTLFTLGMAKYAKEDWDGAIGYFANALNQIQIEEGKEEIDEQSKVLRQATIYNLLGRSYDAKDMAGKSIANYDKAIELNPAYHQAYTNLGNVYYYQERYHLALTNYNKAIELDDKYARAYRGRGDVYSFSFEHEDYEKAIENFDKAIALDDQVVCFYNNRGVAYAKQGRSLASDGYYDQGLDQYYDQALDDYEQALELDPKHTLTYTNRGGLYLNQGEISLAIADYTTAIELDSEEVYAILPWVPLRQRNDGEAIAEFTTAAEQDPENIAVYLLWADFYAVHGDDEKAIENYDKAITLDSDNAEIYSVRARFYAFYANQTNPEKAIADYNKAIELNPQFVDYYIFRADFYARQGNNEKAIADYTKVIELDPRDGYFQRAAFYERQGNNEKAIADYTQLIVLYPDDPAAYYNMARAYSLKGDVKAALENLQRAIDLDETYRESAKTEPAFDAIRQDEQFRELVGE